MSDQPHDRIVAAADHFNKQFLPRFGTREDLRSETIIAATARMAGTMLFRSFAPATERFDPGTVVLSDAADTLAASMIVGMRFVKRERRLWVAVDKWRLIFGILLVTIVIDFVLVYLLLSEKLAMLALLAGTVFVAALRFFGLWLSFGPLAQLIFRKHLARGSQ